MNARHLSKIVHYRTVTSGHMTSYLRCTDVSLVGETSGVIKPIVRMDMTGTCFIFIVLSIKKSWGNLS